MGLRIKVVHNKMGFSLIELMVIIAVLGILSAVTVPNLLGSVPNWRLKNAATDLFGNLQLARSTAIKESSTCTVTFSNSPDGYVITSDGNTIKSVTLSDYKSGVNFDSLSQSSVSFSPRGFADNTIIARLTHSEETWYYTINALVSGAISLRKSKDS